MSNDDDKRATEPKAPAPAGDEGLPGLDALAERELQALRDERDQLEDRLRRALADAANMRRRQQQEAEESRRRIVEGFTQELLPVLDNFEAALQAWAGRSDRTDPATLIEGVRMVHSLLAGALERHGLQEIQAEGQPFDPARHEAIGVESRADVEAGRVLKVLQPGYLLGDRVLRHARVVVSGLPEQKGEQGPKQES